jgi:hypothetical protein
MKPTIKAILATLLVMIISGVLIFFAINYPFIMLPLLITTSAIYFIISVLYYICATRACFISLSVTQKNKAAPPRSKTGTERAK